MFHLRTLFIVAVLLSVSAPVSGQQRQADPTDVAAVEQSDLRYAADPARLYYRLEVGADFGSPRYDQSFQTDLVYSLEEDESGNLKIVALEGVAKDARRSYTSSHPIFRIGPLNSFVGRALNLATIKPDGQTVRVERPYWIMGLPIDAGRLAFPHLRNEEKWTTEESVALVRNFYVPGYLQLLPVSPTIQNLARRPFSRSDRQNESSQVVALARTDWKLVKRTPAELSFEQSYSLQGGEFKPAVAITGEGQIVYSTTRSSVESIDQEYRVTWKEPNQSITVTFTVNLRRMSPEEIEAYDQAQAAKHEQMRKLQAERDALEAALPELSDRKTLFAALRAADEARFKLLILKINGVVNDAQDAQLAGVIYEQFFRLGKVDYLAARLVKQLEPELEKTVSLVENYSKSYGFDVAMTGAELGKETKLTRDQLVCYPASSRWKAGFYYGEIDEVIVLESFDSPRELTAVKRKDCRLPAQGFVDPVVDGDD